MKQNITSIDQYIEGYSPEVQVLLEQMRTTIQKAAPKATEAIKYGLPTFVHEGNLVHFGGFKNHIGFYPAPSGIKMFERELSKYERSKGAIRFPIGERLPLSLVTKIVKYRIKQNEEKAKLKKKK